MASAVYRHGFLVLAASFVGNVFAYMYQLASARLLGPFSYGELIALLSLLVVFTLPFGAVNALVVKYAAIYNARKESGKLSHLYSESFKILFVFGVLMAALLLCLAGPLLAMLNLSHPLALALLAAVVFFTAISIVPAAMLNGLQRFASFSALLALNPFAKFLAAVGLILFGLGCFGALAAAAIAPLIIFAAGFYLTRKTFFAEKQPANLRSTIPYFITILLALGVMSLYMNIDILFVKHFFSSTETGVYGVASEVARIIFFLTSAVTLVLLPKVSEAHSKKQNTAGILYRILGFVALISAACLLGYFLFPEIIVTTLFGGEYAASSALIVLFGIGMTFYALSNVMVYYFISIGRKMFAAVLWLFIVVEIVVLLFFHESLLQIVLVFLGVMIVLFFFLFAYSFFGRRAEAFG